MKAPEPKSYNTVFQFLKNSKSRCFVETGTDLIDIYLKRFEL